MTWRVWNTEFPALGQTDPTFSCLDNSFKLTQRKKQLSAFGDFLSSPLDPKLTPSAFKSKQQSPESDLFHKRNWNTMPGLGYSLLQNESAFTLQQSHWPHFKNFNLTHRVEVDSGEHTWDPWFNIKGEMFTYVSDSAQRCITCLHR